MEDSKYAAEPSPQPQSRLHKRTNTSKDIKPLPSIPTSSDNRITKATLPAWADEVNSPTAEHKVSSPLDDSKSPSKPATSSELRGRPATNASAVAGDLATNSRPEDSMQASSPLYSNSKSSEASKEGKEQSRTPQAVETPSKENEISGDPGLGKRGGLVLPESSTPEILQKVATPTPGNVPTPKKLRSRAGKPCPILLPREDPSDPAARKPLSPSAFKSRIQWYEKNGYNVRGWDHGDRPEGIRANKNYCQSQPIFPDAFEVATVPFEAEESKNPQVVIPDQKRWDDYMKHLTEEKLKALGVSAGDGEVEAIAPAVSRQISSPFPGPRMGSPIVPSSSTNSQHQWQNHMPFSAPFSPSGNTPNTSIGPVGSPAPSAASQIRPGHLSRHSTFGLPSPMTAQNYGLTQSLTPFANLQGSNQHGSPALPNATPRVASGLSQGSPDLLGNRVTPRSSDTSQRASRRGTMLSEQQPLIEVDDELSPNAQNPGKNKKTTQTKREPPHAYGELAFPTPRGHRHNISQNLEREVENAEFYPGEFTDGTPGRSDAALKGLERNEAVTKSHSNHSSSELRRGHQTSGNNASTSSRFNVEAKEFKFDSGKAHTRAPSMSSNPFMPSTAGPSIAPTSSKPAVSLVTAHANSEATGGNQFKAFGSLNKPQAQSDFAFSSNGFNFKPGKLTMDDKENEKPGILKPNDDKPGNDLSKRIFNLKDIVKPSKISKAIPIVNPSSISKGAADEDVEDEAGRITQNKGRFKRGRLDASDGDQVPQFGSPGQNIEAENLKRVMKEASPRFEEATVTPKETRKIDQNSTEAEGFWHDVSDSETVQQEKTPDSRDIGTANETSPSTEEFLKTVKPVAPAEADSELSRAVRKVSANRPRLNEPESDQGGTPTFQEIDAVMAQLNKSDPDLSIQPTQALEESIEQPSDDAQNSKLSELEEEIQVSPSNKVSSEWLRGQRGPRASQSPVHRLNLRNDAPVSDWDDVLASDEENKFFPQAQFFDTRVKSLIEGVLQQHLSPLQNSLKEMDSSVRGMSTKETPKQRSSTTTHDKTSSDADDEDNTEDAPKQSRSRSLKSDKKMDMIKSIVLEAMAAASKSESSSENVSPASIRSLILDALASAPKNDAPEHLSAEAVRSIVTDAIASTAPKSESKTDRLDSTAVKSIVEDALASIHGKFNSVPDPLDRDAIRSIMLDVMASASSKELQGPEQLNMEAVKTIFHEALATSRSNESLERLEDEKELRNNAERRGKDLERMLALSEREIALFREAGEAADDEKAKLREERNASQARISDLERIERELRTKISGLASEVNALEGTLKEYRTSSTKWRQEIESARVARDSLQHNLDRTKKEAEEHSEVRLNLRAQLDKLQDNLENVSNNLVTERRVWQRKDEEQGKETAILSTRLEEELHRRQRLQEDLDHMARHERNAIKANVTLEETRNANARLTAEVTKLAQELKNTEQDSKLHEREAIDTKDIARAEIQRTKTLLEAEIDVANRKAESIRVDLETRLDMAQGELMRSRLNATSSQEEFKRAMDDVNASRSTALREASDANNATLGNERQRFEKLINDLTKQHDTALRNSHDDKQRAESTLQGSVALSNQKIIHLEDVIRHLQDRVTIAQSAAQAAAQAAAQQQHQVAKAAPAPRERPPQPAEKVSPQALRESIVVLQEQLQERESRIEQLEADNARFTEDDAPAKLKERDNEVGWLRELLGLRVDDISELVNLLAVDNYDRAAARNAAIRIRANLQMEQQEKERGGSSGMRMSGPTAPLPSISDIQNFASPKAAQLAAAWGNWRRGRDVSSSLSTLRENIHGFSAANAAESPTPSKRPAAADAVSSSTNAAQNFLSGLMTPPASNARRTPMSQQQRLQSRGHHARQDSQDSVIDDGEGSVMAPSDMDDAQPLPLSLQLASGEFDDDEEEIPPADVNDVLPGGGAIAGASVGLGHNGTDESTEGEKTPTRPPTSTTNTRGRSRQKNVPKRESVGSMSPLDVRMGVDLTGGGSGGERDPASEMGAVTAAADGSQDEDGGEEEVRGDAPAAATTAA